MTTAVDQFNSAGLAHIFWAVNNSAGYPCGTAGTLANGSDASMGELVGPESLNLALQQPRQVSIPGSDGVQAIYFFEPETLPNGQMVLGNIDLTLWAKSQGTKVYADGDFDVVIGQPDSPTYANLTIMTLSQAKSAQSGSVGNAGFMVKIYPRCQIIPIGDSGLSNATGSNFTHQIIANKFDTLPWGAALGTTNHGTTKGAVYGPFYSENRVMLHTHIGDGSDTTLTLAKTPAATNGNKIKLWQDGTAKTYTTHYSASGTTFTFVSAPTAAMASVVRYEYTV